jgi:hypothetical protein
MPALTALSIAYRTIAGFRIRKTGLRRRGRERGRDADSSASAVR